MDKTAIFKVTYGLYVLTTKTADNKINGCIINTAQQVTAIPERISITVAKSNLTHDLIDESKQFCVSVLGEKADLDIVNIFGMQTGREVNKFEHISYKVDQLGNPYIEEGMIAYLTGKVINQIDLGTHTMFIADYVDGKTLGEDKALTYADYREKRNANKPKENQSQRASYECAVCHYEYDGSFEIPFEELPDDYVCPICRQPKSVFMKKETEAATYECSVCHYEYDSSFEVPFEELPDDYVCPICKQPKSVFIKK